MKLRKLCSFVLALAMCLSLVTAAFAENVTGPFSVTVTNKDATGENCEEYVYTAYQLFSGTLDTETEGEGGSAHTVVYLSDIRWGSMFGTTQEAADAAGAVFLAALRDDDTVGGEFENCETAADVAAVLSENNTDTAFAEGFAAFVARYVEANPSLGSAGTSDVALNPTTQTYEYTISPLDPGYYIILNTQVPVNDDKEPYESAWTDPILQVVGDVTIGAKSDLPTVLKEIVDNDRTEVQSGLDTDYTGDMKYTDSTENEAIGRVGDYTVGTDIWFQLTGTLPTNYDSYDEYVMIFHDTESEGLTFRSDSVTVYVDIEGNGALTEVQTGYTVVTEDLDDPCTFEVRIPDTRSLTDTTGNAIQTTKDSRIVVQYQSTLNSGAVIGNDGNPNEVYMEFSNKSYNDGTGRTKPSRVWAFTFELDVLKTDETGVELEGARFILGDENESRYIAIYDGNGSLIANSLDMDAAGSYTFGWVNAAEAVTEGSDQNVTVFESDSDGNFSITGLDEGTYFLKEIAAPAGYNLLESSIQLVIEATYELDASGSVTCSDLTITVDTDSAVSGNASAGTVETTVVNRHGSTLPSTGGIGTAIFYVIGGVLVAGAVVVLVARRRMSRGE